MGLAHSRRALDRAKASQQTGDIAEAERLCLSILRRDGGDVDALHFLALLHAQRGRFEEACQHVDRALGLSPERAELHFHRAEILRALRLDDQALDSYRQALALRPDFLEAVINLGDLLLCLERAEEALAQFARALELQPDSLGALNNRGNALQALKRYDEALQCFDEALAASPADADILNNRANTLLSLGRYAEAEASCTEALRLRPNHVPALLNRGKTQFQQGLFAEGLASYDAALVLKPDYFEAWYDRAMVLTELRRYREALQSYDRALALKPDSWSAWNDCGNTWSQSSQYQNALQCYDQAYSLQPGNALVANNRGVALRVLERDEEAADAFENVLKLDPAHPYVQGKLAWLKMHMCSWQGVGAATDRIVAGVRAGERISESFELIFLSDSARDQLSCARTHARDQYPKAASPIWRGERYPHSRIRLAYLSADFRVHPTSFLLAGLLERHDRRRFETFGLSLGPKEQGVMATRIAAAFEHFIDIHDLSDGAIAELLRRNEIDIAVDLMGFTRSGRTTVFALRPCPVQVNYLGYPGTMGADYIDYLIADAFVIPAGRERDYAEKIARLPDTFQANDSQRTSAHCVPDRSELGLPERGVVFCSFNNSAKIAAGVFGVWMQILRAVESSVLWLWGGSAPMQNNLRRAAEASGVSAERLVFASWAPYPEHLARLHQADLALDTLPFNGGATTSDALRCGVPVITCPGDAFAARMAGSLLHAVGMPELITASLEEYRELAVRLATDADLLARAKRKVADNCRTHPLFDTDRFRRHIESAYETMWMRYQNGEPPADFSVDSIER